jgi:hypothetical protein
MNASVAVADCYKPGGKEGVRNGCYHVEEVNASSKENSGIKISFNPEDLYCRLVGSLTPACCLHDLFSL